MTTLKLLELQRHLMLMYTSCGWFFDELSGIETVQVIQYAGRAVQLSQEVLGDHVEDELPEALAQAKSNLPEHRDGACDLPRSSPARPRWTWRKWLRTTPSARCSSLYADHARIYCYSVDRLDHQSLEAGRMRLGLGRARFTSEITHESSSSSSARCILAITI